MIRYANNAFSIACSIFGEDRVDITNSDEERFEMLIHFPEVTISNEVNNTYNTKDLWVKIIAEKLNPGIKSRKAYVDFFVASTNFTANEYALGFIHPHVPLITLGDKIIWQSPCLGTGRVIKALKKVKSDVANSISWVVFLNGIKEFIETESLNGGPYKKCATVENYKTSVSDFPFRYIYIGPTLVNAIKVTPIVKSLLTKAIIRTIEEPDPDYQYYDLIKSGVMSLQYSGATAKDLWIKFNCINGKVYLTTLNINLAIKLAENYIDECNILIREKVKEGLFSVAQGIKEKALRLMCPVVIKDGIPYELFDNYVKNTLDTPHMEGFLFKGKEVPVEIEPPKESYKHTYLFYADVMTTAKYIIERTLESLCLDGRYKNIL